MPTKKTLEIRIIDFEIDGRPTTTVPFDKNPRLLKLPHSGRVRMPKSGSMTIKISRKFYKVRMTVSPILKRTRREP